MSEPKKQVELPPLPRVMETWSAGEVMASNAVEEWRDDVAAIVAAKDAALEAANARIAELEKSNAKVPKMYVWGNGRLGFYATAQAYSVDEARTLLLEETGTTDGSCPVRARAIEQIRHEQPTIFYRPNAQFTLTDSGELEEMDDYAEKLRAKLTAVEGIAKEAAESCEYCGTEDCDHKHGNGNGCCTNCCATHGGMATEKLEYDFVRSIVRHKNALFARIREVIK